MIFLLTRGLRGDFHAIVGMHRIDMRHIGHHFAVSRIITFQVVCEEPTGFAALPFEEATKEAPAAFFTAPLQQNIQGIAILIDGPQEILLVAADNDDGFIKVLGIAHGVF